ncbi:hypothetical protein Ccrd_015555 [Cynara cardunculus var. scolymus]|uniref:Uncharacterized protein n=1 Tax=Cynara cardunculus var. scolymus TaxID=59895 RepID=A0A103YBM2_CYNCS|nr:hypothetical protein Ccrd_015555 [Cynara cardunculus var. scolymus]
MVLPMRRVWLAVGARGGLLKLHDDIQTCGYEDIQVMWEILRRTESGATSNPAKRKPKPFWKILVATEC